MSPNTKKKFPNPRSILIFLILFPLLPTFKSHHLMADTKKGESWQVPREIREAYQQADVLILGEEHDDKDGHTKKLRILESLSQESPTSLSLEMLEWHEQTTLDEYLSGLIPYSSFSGHSVLWKNFSESYLPLVDFAKEMKMPVIAANPPRKYVNLISRKGMLAYRDLPRSQWKYLPQPQFLMRDRQHAYDKRLREVFGSFHQKSKDSSPPLDTQKTVNPAWEKMILAQNAWDAGMTEKIAQEFFRTGNKIIHVNGRFHSDYGLGVAYRLRKAGLRVVTVTLLPDTEENRKKTSEDPPLADFLIFTNTPILE